MPNTKNFSYSTVLTAPSPATSGTSLVVQSGDGAKFPSTSFNATIWPAGVRPTSTNGEIVTVTNVSTDTFTIVRQAESSSNRAIVVGDQIAATITAGLFPLGVIVGTTDSQTLTNKEVSGGVVESNVFHDILTTQNITLPASRDFRVLGSLELSASYSLEVPATTSLEIADYAPSVNIPGSALGRTVSAGNGTAITATGNYVVTGVGFEPRVIQIFANISNASNACWSQGFYDRIAGTTGCLSINAQSAAFGSVSSTAVVISTQAAIGTKQAEGTIASTNSDGFILNIATFGTVNTAWRWIAWA